MVVFLSLLCPREGLIYISFVRYGSGFIFTMIYDAFHHSHSVVMVYLADHSLSYDICTILFNSDIRELHVIQHRV